MTSAELQVTAAGAYEHVISNLAPVFARDSGNAFAATGSGQCAPRFTHTARLSTSDGESGPDGGILSAPWCRTA